MARYKLLSQSPPYAVSALGKLTRPQYFGEDLTTKLRIASVGAMVTSICLSYEIYDVGDCETLTLLVSSPRDGYPQYRHQRLWWAT